MKITTAKVRTAKGFTITELMVTSLLSTLVVLSLGSVLADNHKGYNHLRTVVHGDVAEDSYISRMMFDKICRKASIIRTVIDINGQWLQVFYYSDPMLTLSAPDMYAVFRLEGNELKLHLGPWEHETLTMSSATSSETIASNVVSVSFDSVSSCVQMNLEIDNGSQSAMVVCSSVRHNE